MSGNVLPPLLPAAPAPAAEGVRRRSLTVSASLPALPSQSRVLYSRGSLSSAVKAANQQVASMMDKLQKAERPTWEGRGSSPNSSEMRSDPSSGLSLPPIGKRRSSAEQTLDIFDDIKGLLRDATRVYGEPGASESKSVAPAPARAEDEAKGKTPKSKKRSEPRPEPPKRVPRSEEGHDRGKSEAQLYVRRTLAELREDGWKREQFAQHVATLMRVPDQSLVKANVAAVHMSSSDFLENRRQESQARYERYKAHSLEVLERRDEEMARRFAELAASISSRFGQHAASAAMRRKNEAWLRQAAWLSVVGAVVPATRMGAALADHRLRRKELALKLASSKSFVMMWRIYVMRKRLSALTKVRRLLRARFYFYRINRRIKQKRAASTVLTQWLRAVDALSAPHKLVRRYAFSIKRIQATWRRRWLIISTHLELVCQRWIDSEVERGLSRSAAMMNDSKEHATRLQVIREDLRLRQALHFTEMQRYRKLKREYDEWKDQQNVMEEARLLAGGKRVNLAEIKKPKPTDARQPPPRPHFALSGPPGHFKVLAERVKKALEHEQELKKKQWLEQDRLKLQRDVQKVEQPPAGQRPTTGQRPADIV